MAGSFPMKMKRKDLEDVNDEFSDFSLCSPARKIRRLDVELPPILEEEEPEVPLVFDQSVTPKEHFPGNIDNVRVSAPVIEELPMAPENDERAIVLFKPMNSPLVQSPTNFSVLVNSNIISGIKNQILWSTQSNVVKSGEDEGAREHSNTGKNGCLAVVPWVPMAGAPPPGAEVPNTGVPELMDADDMEATTMDIEENNIIAEPKQEIEYSEMRANEGLYQWQQQQQQQQHHCMIPQLPQNTSTPVVWFR